MTRFRRAALLYSACRLATLFILGVLSAAPAHAEGLDQALSAAYLGNPDLDAERARLRATDENVSRAYSGFRPRLEGNAFSGERTYETSPTLPDYDTSTPVRGYQLSLKQPLFRGGRTLSSIAQAEAASESGQAKLRGVEIKTLLQAATAYADVRRDRVSLGLLRGNVSALEAEVAAARARLSAQAATLADVAQAEARVAAARAEVAKAEAQIKSSEARFEEVVGHRPGALAPPNDVGSALLPSSLEQALAAAQDENPQVLAAVKAEAAASYTIDVVRGELLPEVSIEGTWTKTYDPESGVDKTDESYVVGRVRMPLYEGGDTYARVRQAKEQHLAAIQDVRSLRNQAQTNVISAWSHLQSARAQQASSQLRMQAARKALSGLKSELQIGARSVIDVLNAQQEVIDADIADALVKRDALVATFEVLAATGDLTIERLGLVEAVYDAEAHLADVARKPFGTEISSEPPGFERVPAWMTTELYRHALGADASDAPLASVGSWNSDVVVSGALDLQPQPDTAATTANEWTTHSTTGSLPSREPVGWSTSTTRDVPRKTTAIARAIGASEKRSAPQAARAPSPTRSPTPGERSVVLRKSLD